MSTSSQSSTPPVGSTEPSWHFEPIEDIFDHLGSTKDGLSTTEVAQKVNQFGFNKLAEKKTKHPLLKLLEHFQDPMVYLLLLAAIIAFIVDPEDLGTPIFISFALTLNAVFSYIQEAKAEKAMDSLKQLLVSHCVVLRDGMEHRISTEELVPGDVVWLEEGLNVPADIRLIEVHQLSIDESSLTGESEVVYKTIDPSPKDSIIQEMVNMVFMGTVVSSGRGVGLVVRTGMSTELGTIASGLANVDTPPTPLEIKLDSLGKFLGKIAVLSALALVSFNMIAALLNGVGLTGLKAIAAKQFLVAVAIFVAIVPEGLPIILVITLALGMQNMSKKNAIVSRMKVVETLGSATIICTDKTGTLTRNEMSVRSFFCGDEVYSVSGSGFDPTIGNLRHHGEIIPESEMAELKVDKGFKLATACTLLCQNSSIRKDNGKWKAIGNPTDSACAVFGWKMMDSVDSFRRQHPRFKEFTFDRTRKRMTTIHEFDGERWVFSKGAIGPYLSRISHVIDNGAVIPIQDKHRSRIGEVNLEMASQALRVIALTARPLSGKENMEDIGSVESGLIFLGLVGIMDPPRLEVKEAIQKCDSAGVKVMMITGDQQMTAMAIGQEIGIIKDDSEFVTGKQLRGLSDEELDSRLDKIVMFSRVSPDQKLRIVSRLQQAGHVVAMTGDGDNDAPALRQA
ncbi:MAG: HAD-IC family P-type ATPase, partial [Euryarchaeota archaeon]|nr:HAD-IC family P-type ATPase [Euryarchaeota archaeon]